MTRYRKQTRAHAPRLALLAFAMAAWPAPSQAQSSFNALVAQIVADPIYVHSWVGIEIYSIDRKETLFSLNADKLFTPGSTTKVVTEGAALALFGPDYRFETRIFRTGPVVDGVLHGALILVASGDPNLSDRVRPDGTLSFTDTDHSYGGPAFGSYPGFPITTLAGQVAAGGIRRVTGKVRVDAKLFDTVREPGSNVMVSPIAVNDNVVDIRITPGIAGGPAEITPLLSVPYLHFRNRVITGKAGEESPVEYDQRILEDGSTEVVLRGTVAAATPTVNLAYPVDDPARFASAVLAQELARQGVRINDSLWSAEVPVATRDRAHQVASFTSPPLKEDVRVTLKVSQNLHAMMMPYVMGSVLGHATQHADQAGFRLIRNWLRQGGMDLSGSAQWDGEGGGAWTPHFMTRYLAWFADQPHFPVFDKSLPVMGRDGTLSTMIPDSPAAGHVRAKTGTNMVSDHLNEAAFVEGKGLAGYTTRPDGERVAIAIFFNKVPVSAGPGGQPSAQARYVEIVGGAAARLAAGAHLLPIEKIQTPKP